MYGFKGGGIYDIRTFACLLLVFLWYGLDEKIKMDHLLRRFMVALMTEAKEGKVGREPL